MQPFFNLVRENRFTILGMGLLAALIVSSLIALYGTSGFGSQPALTNEDRAILATTAPAAQESTPTLSRPTRILIPDVNLGLDVISSTITVETNDWPLSDDSVHDANFTSSLGNERGTLLLYGHNSWPVLRNANDLSVGERMYLVDENGKTWGFVLSETKIVTPEQVGFIYEDTPFRVVIVTCNGWADEYRRLFYFQPVVS